MERQYATLIENSSAFKTLKREVTGGRLSHAYLFTSEDTLALDIMTDMFLSLVICGGYSGSRADAVFDHTLGDVIRLPEDGEKVKVGDINALTETAYLTPSMLERKFYVISRGETMNEPCQNKLLKTLEEPPSVATLIIKSSSERKLLPTVLSRCRKIELAPFSREALEEELAGEAESEQSLEIALSACRGSLTRAKAMLSDKSYGKLYRIALDVLMKPNTSRDAAMASAMLSDYREELTDIIDFMEIILRDSLCFSAGVSKKTAFENELAEISRRYPPQVALKEMPVLYRARKRMELNGNFAAIIDEMIFSLLEVRAKWK